MPGVAGARILRLALDINVLVADILSRRKGRRGTASSLLVDFIRDGRTLAGPVQLVTSLPIIENFASVLRRHFGYTEAEAAEKAWLLEEYTLEGPMPDHPYVIIGAGFIPFETEAELCQAAAAFADRSDVERLFNEVRDDRYVLETALAGQADILVTANMADFVRGPAIRLERDDVVLYPFAGRMLVIASPAFTAFWLRQGVVPDAAFITAHPAEFKIQPPGKTIRPM